MAKRIDFLEIIENKSVNSDIFILKLLSASELPEMKPGQFVQVKIDGSPETFLRRPFSVHDVDYRQKILKLLVQIAGKGTERLSLVKKGDKLNIIYPLGNSFTPPEAGKKSLLIGGGCGIAPLLFLGKYLKSNNYMLDTLLGFRNSTRVIEFEEYRKLGSVFLSTEDGSGGEKGFVTDHSILNSAKYDKVFCCGPELMMKAVASWCRNRQVQCEVSLEHLMGCGIGACLCCVVDTVKGNLCSCIDGPVFNINDLKW